MDGRRSVSNLPFKHSEITEKILGAFYAVYSGLGYGFLEKVYVISMGIELDQRNLKFVRESAIKIHCADRLVGEYYADLIVEDAVIVEIKAAKVLLAEHEAQLLNYLKATPYEVGLLINFGPRPQQMRRSFENNRNEWWVLQNQR